MFWELGLGGFLASERGVHRSRGGDNVSRKLFGVKSSLFENGGGVCSLDICNFPALGWGFSPLGLSELPGALGASPSARRRSRPCAPLLPPVPGLFCVPDSCAQLRPLRVQAAYKGFRPRGADPGAGPGASFTCARGNGANAAPSALENQAPRVAFIRSAC